VLVLVVDTSLPDGTDSRSWAGPVEEEESAIRFHLEK
jgi:hypothetical protein